MRLWKVTILLEGRENISETSRNFPGRQDAKRFMDRAVKQHGDALLSVKMYKPDGNLFMNWNRTIEYAGTDSPPASDSGGGCIRERLTVPTREGSDLAFRPTGGASSAYRSVSNVRRRFGDNQD